MSKQKQVGNCKQHRVFTEEARRAIIKEIQNGLSKAEASRKYCISGTTIYRWLEKYSSSFKKNSKQVIQSKKEANSYIEFQSELKNAYEQLGRSQMEVMFLNKVLESVSQEYQIDFKKKFDIKLSNGSSKTKKTL